MKYYMISDKGDLIETIEAENLRLAIAKFNEICPDYKDTVYIDTDLILVDESED